MTPTPSEMLAAVGSALYGEHWRRPLADALDIDERQLRRWIANPGRLTAGHGIFADALDLMRSRRSELGEAIVKLQRWID